MRDTGTTYEKPADGVLEQYVVSVWQRLSEHGSGVGESVGAVVVVIASQDWMLLFHAHKELVVHDP